MLSLVCICDNAWIMRECDYVCVRVFARVCVSVQEYASGRVYVSMCVCVCVLSFVCICDNASITRALV